MPQGPRVRRLRKMRRDHRHRMAPVCLLSVLATRRHGRNLFVAKQRPLRPGCNSLRPTTPAACDTAPVGTRTDETHARRQTCHNRVIILHACLACHFACICHATWCMRCWCVGVSVCAGVGAWVLVCACARMCLHISPRLSQNWHALTKKGATRIFQVVRDDLAHGCGQMAGSSITLTRHYGRPLAVDRHASLSYLCHADLIYMTTTIGRTLHCVSRLPLFHISRFFVLCGSMNVCLAGAPSRAKGLRQPWVVG